MTNRQRALLETLYKHKSPLEPELETDLEKVRQEYGPYGAAAFFLEDWNPLRKKGFVSGNPIHENDRIIGKGRITALGEEALKANKGEASDI
jgi:hypothetical protein